MHVAATERNRAEKENHRGDHEICDDDVFESHFSVYASSTIQIMHIKTMIPSQAKNISSPHGGADSASNRPCTSTDNCSGRAGDEETTSATEASSSQTAQPPIATEAAIANTNFMGASPGGRLSAATSNSW